MTPITEKKSRRQTVHIDRDQKVAAKRTLIRVSVLKNTGSMQRVGGKNEKSSGFTWTLGC